MPKHYIFICDNPECDLEVYRYRNLKVCPKCKSTMTREDPVDFRMACWRCGTRQDLEMLAHRNQKQQMVGWLFACGKCAAHTADRDLVIELAEIRNLLKFARHCKPGMFGKINQFIADHLPPGVVYFAAIRVWAHATVGEWSDKDVAKVTISDAIRRWEKYHYRGHDHDQSH